MSTEITDLWAELGADASAALVAHYERLVAEGAVPRTIQRHMVMRAAAEIRRAGLTGEALAAQQIAQWGATGPATAVPAEVLAVKLDRARIAGAVGTILTDAAERGDDSVAPRIGRLARSEVIDAAQRTFGHSVEQSGMAKGWRRQTEGDACELCEWWARSGVVFPMEQTMCRHPGCACAQEFVQSSPTVSAPRSDADRSRDYRNRKREEMLRSETPAQRAERERRYSYVLAGLEGKGKQ